MSSRRFSSGTRRTPDIGVDVKGRRIYSGALFFGRPGISGIGLVVVVDSDGFHLLNGGIPRLKQTGGFPAE